MSNDSNDYHNDSIRVHNPEVITKNKLLKSKTFLKFVLNSL